MASIELVNVSKRFGVDMAVRDASFTIHDGEFFILVGPSGCGKSTLLNMIVGLEQPSEGEIRVDGERVNEVDPKDRNMAMVFQSYALYPHLSVRGNIAFPLKLARLSKAEIERRVARAAAILGLEDLLDRKPGALSGGQRQRVAMGRAIVREPKAFLLDEPLSNLDAKLRAQMRTEIVRLQRRLGTTTVYVTHDQTEAMTLGDRIAVMRHGQVLQIGTPRELYEQPANLFVAGFIGSPAMNFLPARRSPDGIATPIGALATSEELGKRLAAAVGPLVVGFRPDRLQTKVAGEGLHFEVRAEVVEWLGADLFVYCGVDLDGYGQMDLPEELGIVGGHGQQRSLVARIDPSTDLKEGDPLRLCLDASQVQVFDAVSGANLSLDAETTVGS